jgi:hypothetical protein
MPDLNSQEERRHALLNDLTATVGTALLGLQVGCAECHDHKYDPISQADFYRLRAVFEPAIHVKRDQPVARMANRKHWNTPSRIMERGDFRRPGEVVDAGGLRVALMAGDPSRIHSWHDPATRRTRLAEWITDRTNPLTARVIVNRVWQQHFGRGLTDTPGDFGVMGQEPTHPELLDWLAGWFMDHGWSLKQLHRLILTSATWQQRSLLPPDTPDDERSAWRRVLATDPDNRLWSRGPRRRLTGEMLRDNLLQAAGLLNRKQGGPGIMPPLPAELQQTLLKDQWTVHRDASEHDRRSIYVFARRNLRYPMFDAFDRPDAVTACPVRNQSTTAVQSLHLLNSEFSQRVSQTIAASVPADTMDTDGIRLLFDRILHRPPTPEELHESQQFLIASRQDNAAAGLSQLALVLLNLNEFLTSD